MKLGDEAGNCGFIYNFMELKFSKLNPIDMECEGLQTSPSKFLLWRQNPNDNSRR
jgi:hypothetical protein